MGGAFGIAALVGGCSSDVTRFDGPAFNLTSEKAPVPPEPIGGRYSSAPLNPSGAGYGPNVPPPDSYNAPYRPAYGADQRYGYQSPPPRRDDVRVASLPDIGAQPPPSNSAPYDSRYDRAYEQQVPPRLDGTPHRQPAPAAYAPPAAPSQPGPGGELVEVQQGETLYGVSRRTGVAVSAIMDANGLTSPIVQPGQRLFLPRGARTHPRHPIANPIASAGPVEQRAPVAADPPAAVTPAAPAATPVAGGWTGSHELKPGESLYGISRRYGTTVAELQRNNNIADPARMRPGVVLRVPAGGAAAAAAAPPPASPAPAAVETLPQKTAEAAPAAPPRAAPVTGAYTPRIINAAPEPAAEAAPLEEKKVASRGDTMTDVTPIATETPAAGRSATAGNAKFRWPVTGRIIAPYGKRPDGTSNDGINLAVPMGAEVHAAEAGVVAYAGSEIKGFGNLLLIRHDNGWVSAYAHNDQLLVRRGDTVKRGQVIAKAGKSGSVEQPQVHFELRQGSKPVDPLPHLDKG